MDLLKSAAIKTVAIYVAFQPGASAGYQWMFTIRPEAFKDPMMYVYALGQSFFSLSLAGNGTIIYGSYLSDKEDTVSFAVTVAVFDTCAAMLAALVIIPAMATTGAILSESGPGLMFISLPYLFKSMPGGQIVMVVFFVAVLFAGLTSLVNLFEAPIAALQDHMHLSRLKSIAIVGGIGVVVSVCIQGIVSPWMDFVSIYVCPLGAALAGIMFAWVWGKQAVEDAVSVGRKNRIGGWYYPLVANQVETNMSVVLDDLQAKMFENCIPDKWAVDDFVEFENSYSAFVDEFLAVIVEGK